MIGWSTDLSEGPSEEVHSQDGEDEVDADADHVHVEDLLAAPHQSHDDHLERWQPGNRPQRLKHPHLQVFIHSFIHSLSFIDCSVSGKNG